MKILYLISHLKRCGPVNVLFDIVKHLSINKKNMMIVTLKSEEKDSRIDEFLDIGIKVICISERHHTIKMKYNYLLEIINEFKPQVIHSSGIKSDIMNATLRRNDCIHCTTVHNFPFKDYMMAYGVFVGFFMAMINVLTFYMLTPIFCSSSIERHLKKFGVKHGRTIQNGIDTTKFCYIDQEEKLGLRKSYSLPIEGEIYLSMGVLSDRKNPIELIRAFDYISHQKTGNGKYLLLVGSGELYQKCKDYIEKKNVDNVILFGPTENPEILYQVSDYYISSSKAEGLPLAAIEALSSGLSVILSDIDPHIELVNGNKQLGSLYSQGDLEVLVETIARCDINKQLVNRKICREHILSYFNSEKMSHAYQLFYFNGVLTQGN